MKSIHFLLGASSFCIIATTQAGIPLWNITPVGSPVVSVASTNTATVSYTVSNNSHRAHNLVLEPKPWLSQLNACSLAPVGMPNSSCTLNVNIIGSLVPVTGVSGGPVLCQKLDDGTPSTDQCYQPSQADSLSISVHAGPILSTVNAPAILALSVSDLRSDPALTGNPRQITIKNTGSGPATNVTVNASGLPSDTLVAPSSCGTLNPNDTCVITITPGSTSSFGLGGVLCTTGIAAIPGVITVTANDGASVQANAEVLSYGCQYQGGYLFAVDDRYVNHPISGSIGGKVLALSDASGFIYWDADPACISSSCTYTTGAQDLYFGENLASVTGSTNPSGTGTNGPGNTFLISSILTNASPSVGARARFHKHVGSHLSQKMGSH